MGRPLGCLPSPPTYIYVGGVALLEHTTMIVSRVRHPPPSTVYAFGHIVVVLRRSPVSVTSSSPSSRRRADKTLPRPQLDLEFVGHHRAERVQIAEVAYFQY